MAVNYEQVLIKTQDGNCPAYVFAPEGDGPWPGVIFCMDGFGIRPTLFQMAQRLADNGYVILLPDFYYRAGPYGPLVPRDIFARGDVMGAIGYLLGSTDNRKAARDAEAFIAWLNGRADVSGAGYGVTGYCMGGGIALSIAGTWPGQITAAASFHGGGLATDSEASPHLLAPSIKARIYIAGADEDAFYPHEMAERLEKALTDAGVDHRCEIYSGALHGFTMVDFPVYDEAAAERHWKELLVLLAGTLKL